MQSRNADDQPVRRDDFIAAMRQIASTVAVVTTAGPGGKHGATVSSFCSVSADPPTMLVCLHGASRIAECVKQNGRFCLNILPQEMSEIADRFAGRHDQQLTDRFEGIEHGDGRNHCPVIAGAVAFQCQMDTSHMSGSHLVVTGKVEWVAGSIGRPLTYMDGQYRPWLY